MKTLDTPFGKFVALDWMPKDQIIAFTPGEKTVICDTHGNVIAERWIRKPSAVIIKNVGEPDGN